MGQTLKMSEQPQAALEKLADLCRKLGAEVRYHPERHYFMAMQWEGWGAACSVGPAMEIQRQIKQMTAQYPGIVCYCFDPFSTLVYVV